MTEQTNELMEALAEWRDAREAFWAVPAIPLNDPSKRFPPEVWTRLGHAEHRLMEITRSWIGEHPKTEAGMWRRSYEVADSANGVLREQLRQSRWLADLRSGANG